MINKRWMDFRTLLLFMCSVKSNCYEVSCSNKVWKPLACWYNDLLLYCADL